MKNQKSIKPETSFYIDSRKITEKALKKIDEIVRRAKQARKTSEQA